jgi:predicted unusual protein kinase regulating ubiquinone biosynthesis (AarF/ABC1/UbiB family)
MRWLRK